MKLPSLIHTESSVHRIVQPLTMNISVNGQLNEPFCIFLSLILTIVAFNVVSSSGIYPHL